MSMKKIGVLTSGGDAPGMNAAVRAVARTALTSGMEVLGIRRGYQGLLSGDVFEMDLRSVSDIIHHGGTMLYTARSKEYNTPEGVQKAADMCRKLGIPVRQSMAMGDHDNDCGMLRAAGLGVAMGNGSAAAKAAADVCTSTNDDAGVARAIDTWILHKEGAHEL